MDLSMLLARPGYFVYGKSMDVNRSADDAVSGIAGAIGEPARTRMLFCLMDGLAKTSTELATVAEVSPSTASVHLNRLRTENLVKVQARGKHRYYCLAGPDVAHALEHLSVPCGRRTPQIRPQYPRPDAPRSNPLRSRGRQCRRVRS